MASNEAIKRAALNKISAGKNWRPSGRATYSVNNKKVHVRYCSPPRYRFNINPNTLRADYELWICGSEEYYYLIPIKVIRGIYNDPMTYPDRHHPEIRVVSVDINSDKVIFGSGGKSLGLKKYRSGGLRGQVSR